MSKLKVSFDYDGSLARESLQKYATELVNFGYEVHIVTARFEDMGGYSAEFITQNGIKDLKSEHEQLFKDADLCGIPRDRIHFMNMRDKYEFFIENEGFLWHLDDDRYELGGINSHTKTIGISCANGSNWRHKCDKLIKEI